MRKKIVAANWKMNGTKAKVSKLLEELFLTLKWQSSNLEQKIIHRSMQSNVLQPLQYSSTHSLKQSSKIALSQIDQINKVNKIVQKSEHDKFLELNTYLAQYSDLNSDQYSELKKSKIEQPELGIILCSPSIYLDFVASWISASNASIGSRALKLSLGAQNVFYELDGAFTGEISPLMLSDVGCEYAIIGHSERRQIFQESNDMIAKKVKASINNGITPILCIGETMSERSQHLTFDVIKNQLTKVLEILSTDELAKIIIAYEPVWAIGTGISASKEEASLVHDYIRKTIATINSTVAINMHILYGGSVKASNAKELFNMPNIDGGLVGGASLIAAEFINICFAAFD